MDPREKAIFISAYTKILVQAWSSDEYARRLMRDPRSVAQENGLGTAHGAEIEIIRSRDADPDLEAQIRLWEEGATSGKYVLYVPEMPQIETRELSADDLDVLAGGADSCCCCCPCCSCT